MSDEWHKLHISDKTGGVFFRCTVSPMGTFSEIRNMKKRIEAAKRYRSHYSFLDVDSAHIVLDGERYSEPSAADLDAILDELKDPD